MELAPHILLGVARGKTRPKDYPHLEFKVANSTMLVPQDEDIQRHAYYMMKKGTFIGWCLLNNGYTYCDNIYRWFEGDPKMDWVESYEDLIKAMKDDKSGYFLLRHFNKVETVYKHYTERTSGFLFED